MRKILLLTLGTCVLALTACGRVEPPPSLPTGIQTMTGTLLPAEISTLRRGTHLLILNGQRLCFVESSAISLRSFEGKTVVIRGIFEPNSDPALLPVLVTQDVTTLEQDIQHISLSAFGLRGSVPRSWIMATQKNATVFLIEGTATPLITIARLIETPLPASGAPLQVSGHHATRQVSDDSSEEVVSIESGDDLIVLTFTPSEVENIDLLHAQWLAFLTSLSFATDNGTTSSAAQSQDSTGTPCGGTAGILCPAGHYCEITEFKENIGHCREF
ncbi:hypothetical protein AUJ46_05125 [Candidatus Peregrinibacteria bacterium CG1_02_54_53]|nr:MAG: hypothetical protein AUJ46_05125 [Candidatus Peregrinibacteria bacterium CG1_02_54_53]